MSLTILIFTATVTVLSALKAAPGAFAASEVYVISEASAPTIFSSQVDASIGPLLDSFPNITGASSEIFAFSSWNGVSFTVRGVDLARLNETGPDFKEFDVVEGRSVLDGSSAVVGARLLERLSLELPTTIPLVGSYAAKMELVNVVASFTSSSSLDDELLVSLDVARTLSGMPHGRVSIIRVSTSNPGWLESVLSPDKPQFLIFDLSVSKAVVRSGDSVGVTVGVRNWGKAQGTAIVHIGLGSDELAAVPIDLGPSESGEFDQQIQVDLVPPTGSDSMSVTIAAWIDGDLPMTLNETFLVSKVAHSITAPGRVALGSNFNVSVLTYDGVPAVGAVVTFQGASSTVGESGQVTLYANQTGSFGVDAFYDGGTVATSVQVVDWSSQPNEFLPSVVGLSVTPASAKEGELASGVVIAQNSGTVPGTFELTVSVDNGVYVSADVLIGALGTVTYTFELRDISVGSHAVQAGTFSVGFDVRSWVADNPDFVELLIKYGGTGAISRSDSIPIYQAAKISEGNISVALTAIGAVSALLAALAITSIFSKEIHEGRRRLGILKTIGATGGDIRKLVFPQALENGLAGAAIGVAAGIVLLDIISRSGAFLVFGHQIQFDFDSGLLILVMIGAVSIGLASALVSSMLAVRETTISSVRRLDEEAQAPIDVSQLLGDE